MQHPITAANRQLRTAAEQRYLRHKAVVLTIAVGLFLAAVAIVTAVLISDGVL